MVLSEAVGWVGEEVLTVIGERFTEEASGNEEAPELGLGMETSEGAGLADKTSLSLSGVLSKLVDGVITTGIGCDLL